MVNIPTSRSCHLRCDLLQTEFETPCWIWLHGFIQVLRSNPQINNVEAVMYQIQSLLKQQRVVKIKIILIWLLFFVGGETIRNIIKASGAHVELNRNIPESSPTKCFMIRGIKNKMCFHRKLFFLFIIPRIFMLKWSIWTTEVKNFCERKIKQLEQLKKLVGPRFKSLTMLLSWMFKLFSHLMESWWYAWFTFYPVRSQNVFQDYDRFLSKRPVQLKVVNNHLTAMSCRISLIFCGHPWIRSKAIMLSCFFMRCP